jgi:hypothetical protein
MKGFSITGINLNPANSFALTFVVENGEIVVLWLYCQSSYFGQFSIVCRYSLQIQLIKKKPLLMLFCLVFLSMAVNCSFSQINPVLKMIVLILSFFVLFIIFCPFLMVLKRPFIYLLYVVYAKVTFFYTAYIFATKLRENIYWFFTQTNLSFSPSYSVIVIRTS